MCSYSSMCLIVRGLFMWQIDVFRTPSLSACVRGCVWSQRHREVYTHDWLHDSTPRTGSRPQRSKRILSLCTHSPISQFLSHFSAAPSLALTNADINKQLCAVSQGVEEEEGGGRGEHPGGALLNNRVNSSLCGINGRITICVWTSHSYVGFTAHVWILCIRCLVLTSQSHTWSHCQEHSRPTVTTTLGFYRLLAVNQQELRVRPRLV